MTLGVYSNNFIPREKYAINENTANAHADADGHSSFLEEFIQDEEADKRLKSALEREEKQVEDIPVEYTIPSHSKISDYIDNYLLINAEQVACTNMTQHLIKSDELKETLGFLNTQAAKTMFEGRKRPDFSAAKRIPQFKTGMLTTRPINHNHTQNFFSTGIDGSTNNFFMTGK